MYGIIYVVTNTVNGKQYVGQTTYPLEVRWCGHLKSAKEDSQCLLYRSIRKYGTDKFTIEQIDTAESQDELDEKEIHHVARLGAYGSGYNLTVGGGGCAGYTHTEETRVKLSKALAGHVVFGETRQKQSEAATGRGGWHHSEETRRKQSEAHKGRSFSKETRQKMSEAQLFRSSDSEETHQKKSESAKLRHSTSRMNAE